MERIGTDVGVEHFYEKMRKTIEMVEGVQADTEVQSRFSNAIWYETAKRTYCTIVGLGGIGSHLAYMLSRINPASIDLVDFDKVSADNMGTQMFLKKNIGEYKVDSVDSMCLDMNLHRTPMSIYREGIEQYYSSNKNTFVCTDSIESRRKAFEAWKDYSRNSKYNTIFIDGRCTFDRFVVYAVPSCDASAIRRYEQELFPKEEVEEVQCGAKQTTFIACMTAATMMSVFTNFLIVEAGGYANIPFKTEYDQVISKTTVS